MRSNESNKIESNRIDRYWQLTNNVCMHHILNVYGNRSNNCRRNMAAGKHSDFFCMSRSINQSWTKSPNGLAVIANTILTFCVRNNQLCISNSFRAESIQSNLYASNRIELYRIVSHWNCINHFLFVAQHLCNVMFEFLLIFLLLSYSLNLTPRENATNNMTLYVKKIFEVLEFGLEVWFNLIDFTKRCY